MRKEIDRARERERERARFHVSLQKEWLLENGFCRMWPAKCFMSKKNNFGSYVWRPERRATN
jgi:hypothetical protein